MGQAAALDMIVGRRSSVTKELLFDKNYDVLQSGVPNAIRVAKEVLEPMGKRLKGVRIDSGDLAYLSKKTRAMLDAAGPGRDVTQT